MRVLTLTRELPTGMTPGVQAPVARQIESVRAVGVDVEVLEVKGTAKLKYLRALPPLLKRISACDLVHAHYGYCGWLARMQLERPIVVSFMGSDLLGTSDGSGRVTRSSRFVVAIDRWLARRVAAVIVKSPEMAAAVAPVKAHVVPNGVDLELFRPTEKPAARAELGWDEMAYYVLFPGAPENRRKGFPLAQATIERAAAEIGASVELVPLSGIAPDRVPLYMNACDALVMTSYWEGSPNTVKEAMACNLPVVSVPVGDVLDLLRGVTKCPVRSRDAGPLGEALARILSDRGRTNGRDMIRRKGLALEDVAARVAEIYEDVLHRDETSTASR